MNHIMASAVLTDLFPKLFSNTITPVFRVAEHGALADFILPPGHIIVLGGMPGVGKSSFIFQVLADFLRLNVDCRALIANVEMDPEELLTREISRLSGVYLGFDRAELSDEEKERLQSCKATLDSYAPRLAIIPMPFTLDDIIEAIDRFNPTLVVIDYMQCVDTGERGGDNNERLRLNRMVAACRGRVADRIIIMISAIKRTASNYNPKDLGMDSYRESGGIEYGCNFGYIMIPDVDSNQNGDVKRVILRHLKSRSTGKKDIHLVFDGRLHRWVGADDVPSSISPENVSDKETTAQLESIAPETKTNLLNLWHKHQEKKASGNGE